ncbi:MAG: tRNA pseudouridine(13) synthase TruD [Candidatus Aenigmatarchaeota archaeon]|nr:MAG: tRNA pseudouridine(13) synthase TruD [Candidatus Aenigmarchaeota archaeon]
MTRVWDEFCGIKIYWTESPGIGGVIKKEIEDFIVEEIPVRFRSGKGYVICLMEKRNLETFHALRIISKVLGINKERIGFAGLKDKRAMTKQYISIKGVSIEKLSSLQIENIRLSDFRESSEPISLGMLRGNRFTIRIRDTGLEWGVIESRLKELQNEVKERMVPNFFGLQRFGETRPVSYLVGREIIRKDFERAVWLYLTETFETEPPETIRARENLSRTHDLEEAKESFQNLYYESRIINSLLKGRSYTQVLKLMLELTRLFVHAYQSYIFNLTLSEFLKGKDIVGNFPAKVVGYRVVPEEGEFDEICGEILEKEGVKPEDFKIKELDLDAPGSVRPGMMKADFDFERDEDVTLRFELKPGSYATVLLREITKNQKSSWAPLSQP